MRADAERRGVDEARRAEEALTLLEDLAGAWPAEARWWLEEARQWVREAAQHAETMARWAREVAAWAEETQQRAEELLRWAEVSLTALQLLPGPEQNQREQRGDDRPGPLVGPLRDRNSIPAEDRGEDDRPRPRVGTVRASQGSVRKSMSTESEEGAEIIGRVALPGQPFLSRLVRGSGRILQRCWRRLPFARVAGDLVDCTVFAPPAVAQGETVLVQVFAHTPEQAEVARQQATEFDAAAARRGFRSLETAVERGSKLSFHLVMHGAGIDGPVQHLVGAVRRRRSSSACASPATAIWETWWARSRSVTTAAPWAR